MSLYPLRFVPLLRHYPWGGRRLATALGLPLGKHESCAESWMVCDRGKDQTVVAHGALGGVSLGDLVARHGSELLGRHHPQTRFPLLFKFLDARERLSVQVHPNDQQAGRWFPGECGKTEAWVVLEAEPDSVIYAGLKPGIDEASFRQALAQGNCQACLHQLQPRVGDCLYIPAGLVHALGGGVLVAEVQQPSDITFRLFDWHRLGSDGQPRTLHVAQALETIDYGLGPATAVQPTPGSTPSRERLLSCAYFVLDRAKLTRPETFGGDRAAHLLVVLEGEVRVEGDTGPQPLGRGGTILLPACCGAVRVLPVAPSVVLDCYLP